MLDLSDLKEKTVDELREVAATMDVAGYSSLKKFDLCMTILKAQSEQDGNKYQYGVLEVQADGRGYLRVNGYVPDPAVDIYVADSQIRRFDLRTGDVISGPVRPPKNSERYWSLLRVQTINGVPPEEVGHRPDFEDLTPVYPDERIHLETDDPTNITGRLLDIITPIGRGQRGLIVSPPKAGKTTVIKQLANCMTANYDDLRLLILLVDERPEEVTDIARSVEGEVISSTFDELPENHMRVAELVLTRAKRLVEQGEDVVVLLDSITRLSRASNLTIDSSGRTLSGGLDPIALYRPKRFLGAARNIEEGGSLTILATILVETGSRMDDIADRNGSICINSIGDHKYIDGRHYRQCRPRQIAADIGLSRNWTQPEVRRGPQYKKDHTQQEGHYQVQSRSGSHGHGSQDKSCDEN